MIFPRDIKLLIFDLDGTIFKSDKLTFEIVKKAFSQMGLNDKISKEDIAKHLGEPSDDFYKNILPQGKSSLRKDLMEKMRKQYKPSIMKKFGCAFSDVVKTLKFLRERGRKLALYSNCSCQYFDCILSFLGIRKYFDYLECKGENNLTKIALVQKIQNQFPNLKAAVIGDRASDIEAASVNNILSIGALYGYGRNEALKADIAINKFSELLNIVVNKKLLIFEKILEEIKRKKKSNKAFVVGINGIDASGKTKFTESFQEFLVNRNYKTQVINLDDFHNQKNIRYSGKNEAENYYNKSFNIKTIVEKLLIPLCQENNFSVELTLLNLHTDKYEIRKTFSFQKDTIVLFEGVFLFRKELLPYIDYKIFLDISFGRSKNRARIRDIPILGSGVLKKYDKKYLPAQKKYLKEFPFLKIVDIVIDNSDWKSPKIKKINSVK